MCSSLVSDNMSFSIHILHYNDTFHYNNLHGSIRLKYIELLLLLKRDSLVCLTMDEIISLLFDLKRTYSFPPQCIESNKCMEIMI